MTERIFDDQPGLETLETTVISCTPAGKEWDVRLAATVFFPRGGGQPCEGGTIGTEQVLDVFYDEAGDILHRVAGPVACGPVEIAIDSAKRWEHRQQHSAQPVDPSPARFLGCVSEPGPVLSPQGAHLVLGRPQRNTAAWRGGLQLLPQPHIPLMGLPGVPGRWGGPGSPHALMGPHPLPEEVGSPELPLVLSAPASWELRSNTCL